MKKKKTSGHIISQVLPGSIAQELEIEPGDVLLLCSDGLSGVVNAQELLFEVVYGGELETAAERMVNIALERGAPDNVTALIMTADDPQPETL